MAETGSDKSKFVSDTLGEPLDVKRHDIPERHEFGEALLTPNDADVLPTGPVSKAGISPKVARVDHVHQSSGGSGGVTDHGALTGLADDDHPQYTTDAEATTIANTAVTNHNAASDPHAIYLRIAEILAGANVTVTDNGNGTVTIGAPNLVPTTRAINTTAPLTGGGSLAADKTLAISPFAGSAAGSVPVSVGGTTNFLRADGTWAAPPASGGATAHSALTGLGPPANDHPQYTLYQFLATINVDTVTGHGTWAIAPSASLSGTYPTAPFAAASAFEFWQSEHTASTKLLQTIHQGTFSWQRSWGGSSWGAWSQFIDLATGDTRYGNSITGVMNIAANISNPAGSTAIITMPNQPVVGSRWYRFTAQFDCSAALHQRNTIRLQLFGSPGMSRDFNWSVSASDAFMSFTYSVIYQTGAAETSVVPVMYHMSGANCVYYATGGTYGFYFERL